MLSLSISHSKGGTRQRRSGGLKKKSLICAKRLNYLKCNSTHVDISAPQNKCTALICTAFRYANGSMSFGTPFMCTDIKWLPKERN